MNQLDYEVTRALRRVEVFAAAHAAQFPPGSRALEVFARVTPLLEELGTEDLARGVPASGATVAKVTLFEELWQDLKGIVGTARTIARDEPGFATDFPLGEDTQRGILATAEAFLKLLDSPDPGTPALVAKFVAYDLPADFVTDLKADLAAINGKAGKQTDDLLSATGETASTRTLLTEARDILKRLDTSVRNRFRRNPDVLAQWRAASRVHRAPRPETPPPAADSEPDPGADSGPPASPAPQA